MTRERFLAASVIILIGLLIGSTVAFQVLFVEIKQQRDDAINRLNATNQCISQFFNSIYRIEFTSQTQPPNETQFRQQLIDAYESFGACLGH